MNQQTFTRKEVRALLKRQITAAVNSYGTMEINMGLARNPYYADEIDRTRKRLKNLTIVKF